MEERKVAAPSKQILAYNKLVFSRSNGSAVKSLADLQGLQRIAIGTPASVPAGKYAEQAMKAAGIYEELVRQKKLVMAQDVRQALDRDELGHHGLDEGREALLLHRVEEVLDVLDAEELLGARTKLAVHGKYLRSQNVPTPFEWAE